MNKHKKCSKRSTLKTTENSKEDPSVCKACYNTKTLNLMKKRFGLLEEKSSSEQDSSSKQDISDIQDSSNKQDISNKQNRSSKQDIANKQEIPSNYIIDADPDLLCEKLR